MSLEMKPTAPIKKQKKGVTDALAKDSGDAPERCNPMNNTSR